MYVIRLYLRPTGGLTFRVLPGSLLHIATYPFVPPSTLSGFLKRLALLTLQPAEPLEREVYPETYQPSGREKKMAPYYVLPRNLISLGAYPRWEDNADTPARTFPDGRGSGIQRLPYRVHKTYRQGPRSFRHSDFSRLHKEGKVENFQLHTWEYLMVGLLVGYVACEHPKPLEAFSKLQGYGTKLGREGYAFLERIEGPTQLRIEKKRAVPSSLLPLEADPLFLGDIYQVYHHRWERPAKAKEPDLFDRAPSPVEGFSTFMAAFPTGQMTSRPVPFYCNGEGLFIPARLVELIRELQEGLHA